MDRKELKERYVGAIILIIIGVILFSFLNFENGLIGSNIIFIIFGVLGLIGGIIGILNPGNIFFETILELFKKFGNSPEENNIIKQNQNKTKRSNQIGKAKNVKIIQNNNYYNKKSHKTKSNSKKNYK